MPAFRTGGTEHKRLRERTVADAHARLWGHNHVWAYDFVRIVPMTGAGSAC
jgi:hypothetical protein